MKLLFLCILLAMTIASARQKRTSMPYYPYNPYEGHGELYDDSKQKCCHGVGVPKTRASYIRCCGNTTYDMTEEICCQGTPVPLTYKTRTSCCGSKTYDIKESMCCMGKIILPPKGTTAEDLQYFECRRSKAIDTRDTRQNELEPSAEEEVSFSGGSSPYRPYPYPPHFPHQTIRQRCNGTKFNATTHACCNNTIKESPKPNAACCGEDQLYDDKKKVCCHSPDGSWKLSPKPPTNPNSAYYSDMSPCCCGGVAYDMMADHCCNDILRKIPGGANHWEYQCCGSDIIDSSSHTCCDGQNAIEKKDDAEGCCGNNTFSYQKQLCCYHKEETKVYDKVEKQRSQCCAGKVINTKDQLCCYDYQATDGNYENVVDKKTNGGQCCGSSVYDVTKEICCGTTKSPLEAGGERQQCCGDKAYNPNKQVCCDNEVLDVEDESKRSCCSIHTSDDYLNYYGIGGPSMHRPPPVYHTMGRADEDSNKKSSEEETGDESSTTQAAISK